MTDPAVVLGVDIGGSSSRVRGSHGGTTVFDGVGGPANPTTLTDSELERSLAPAFAGAPRASQVVVAAAGAARAEPRRRLAAVVKDLCPGAAVDVLPDFAASARLVRGLADVAVVVGTGSVVCHLDDGGEPRASGGLGWILGDPGSAARLGQDLLRHLVDDPEALPRHTLAQLRDALGTSDPRTVAIAVITAPAPPTLLARAAPALCDLADSGDPWASAALAAQMHALSRDVQRHLVEHGFLPAETSLGLVGGLWRSTAARASFAEAVAPDSLTVVDLHQLEPVDGAVLLALDHLERLDHLETL